MVSGVGGSLSVTAGERKSGTFEWIWRDFTLPDTREMIVDFCDFGIN